MTTSHGGILLPAPFAHKVILHHAPDTATATEADVIMLCVLGMGCADTLEGSRGQEYKDAYAEYFTRSARGGDKTHADVGLWLLCQKSKHSFSDVIRACTRKVTDFATLKPFEKFVFDIVMQALTSHRKPTVLLVGQSYGGMVVHKVVRNLLHVAPTSDIYTRLFVATTGSIFVPSPEEMGCMRDHTLNAMFINDVAIRCNGLAPPTFDDWVLGSLDHKGWYVQDAEQGVVWMAVTDTEHPAETNSRSRLALSVTIPSNKEWEAHRNYWFVYIMYAFVRAVDLGVDHRHIITHMLGDESTTLPHHSKRRDPLEPEALETATPALVPEPVAKPDTVLVPEPEPVAKPEPHVEPRKFAPQELGSSGLGAGDSAAVSRYVTPIWRCPSCERDNPRPAVTEKYRCRCGKYPWTCAACTRRNAEDANECKACLSPNPVPPPWFCTTCTLRNGPDVAECRACGSRRPS
jgi:hypothetical protein